MTTPNPACNVNGGAPPQDVSANASVTIALASTAGANYWNVWCSSTDDSTNAAAINASLVINQTNKTATFSAVGAGTAYIFTSQVGVKGLGIDANGAVQQSYTTTFKVNVLSAGGNRVVAANETTEQNASCGWTAVVNALARSTPLNDIRTSGNVLDLYANSVKLLELNGGTLSSNNTALLLQVNTNGVLAFAQVSVGVTDSGGSGFRLLRVPN